MKSIQLSAQAEHAPRPYDSSTRRNRQRELRERLAKAAAELHAEKGALATSYADIAARAGVSLPTVYSYFPEQDALIDACTSHVLGKAPLPDAARLLAITSLPEAAAALVEAMDRLNAHMRPWMGWREDRLIPFLARMGERRRGQQTEFVRALLAQHLGPEVPEDVAAAWESILHFDFWHRLVSGHSLSRDAARALQIRLLLAAVGPQPAITDTPGPRSEP